MTFLHNEKFTIATSYTLEQVLGILKKEILPNVPWYKRWLWKYQEKYIGDIVQQGFKIKQIIVYQRRISPIILGTFEPTPSGVKIHIRQRVPKLVVAGCLVGWFSFTIMVFLVGLDRFLLWQDSNARIAISLFALLFCSLIIKISFVIGASINRKN